jgi:hypothetical protein
MAKERKPRGYEDISRLEKVLSEFSKSVMGQTRARIPSATTVSGVDKGVKFTKLKKAFDSLAKAANVAKGALGGIGGFLMGMLKDLEAQFKLWKQGARTGLGFGGGTEGAQQGANVMSQARHYQAMWGIESGELQSIMSQAIHSGMARSSADLTGAEGSRYERGLIEQVKTTSEKMGMSTGQVLTEGAELAKLGAPLEDVNQVLLELADSGRAVGRAEQDHIKDVKTIQGSLRKYNMNIEIADGLAQAFAGSLERGVISTEAISSIFTGTTDRAHRGARAFVAERSLARGGEDAQIAGVTTGGFRGSVQLRSALEGGQGEDAQMAALRMINEEAKAMAASVPGAVEGSQEFLDLYSQIMEEHFGIQTANTLDGTEHMKNVIDQMVDPADKIGTAAEKLEEYAENMPEEWRGSFEGMAQLWSDTWDDTIGDLAWAESHFKSPIEKIGDVIEMAKQALLIALMDIAAFMDEEWFDGSMGVADMWTDELRGSLVGSIGSTMAQMMSREHGDDVQYSDLSGMERAQLALYSGMTEGYHYTTLSGDTQLTQEAESAAGVQSKHDAAIIDTLMSLRSGDMTPEETIGDMLTSTRGSLFSRTFTEGLSHLEEAGLWRGEAGAGLGDFMSAYGAAGTSLEDDEMDEILGQLSEVFASSAAWASGEGLLTGDAVTQLEDTMHEAIKVMAEEHSLGDDWVDRMIEKFDDITNIRVGGGDLLSPSITINTRTEQASKTIVVDTQLFSDDGTFLGFSFSPREE